MQGEDVKYGELHIQLAKVANRYCSVSCQLIYVLLISRGLNADTS